MFEVAAEWWMTEKSSAATAEEREDMLGRVLKILKENGHEVDYGPREVKAEVHTAL